MVWWNVPRSVKIAGSVDPTCDGSAEVKILPRNAVWRILIKNHGTPEMTCDQRVIVFLSMAVATVMSGKVSAAEHEHGEQHHHMNHIAFLVGNAKEEQEDGHHESGGMWGIEYIRQIVNEHWRIGAAFEMETFGDNHDRYGVLAFPVSYFVTPSWRVFVAPGLEFGEHWKSEDGMIRLGTGYTFELTERFSITPEAQVDFVEGGKEVYVLSLAFGLAF